MTAPAAGHRRLAEPRAYRRFVALGDSQTEGLNDLDARGVPIGWADRLAGMLARSTSPDLRYANLAVRRVRAAHVHQVQLPAALALEPDLATVAVGMNDVLRHDFDFAATADHVEATIAALVESGCTVATMTFPDIGRMLPVMSWLRPREERLNARIRELAVRYDLPLLEIYPLEMCGDLRMWSHDRIHGSAEGHRRIADGMAEVLGLPGVDPGWADFDVDGGPSVLDVVRRDLQWAFGYMTPWLLGQLRPKRSGDDEAARAKRPELLPVGEQVAR